MSLMDRIEIAKDKLQMEKDRKAIERRDSRIKQAKDLLATGEISQELADLWIKRANDEYANPKGNLLERAGKAIADKMIQAGENIAEAQRAEGNGKPYWQTVRENIRNLPQDTPLNVNIPESGINLDAIPQNTINTEELHRHQIMIQTQHPSIPVGFASNGYQDSRYKRCKKRCKKSRR